MSADDDPSPEALRFIATKLPVVPVAGAPEIRLHQADPSSALWRLAEMADGDFAAPYWAHCWGGGLALARHVLDRPELARGRAVLDLGAGSGLVGIAAAKAGARTVIAADVDRYALAAVRLNAAANDVAIQTFLGDLTALAPPAVDLVLVGDLFYERNLAARVTRFLDRCAQNHIEVVIGDPLRAHLPRSRLRLLAEYPVCDFGEGPTRERRGAVFSFASPARPARRSRRRS